MVEFPSNKPSPAVPAPLMSRDILLLQAVEQMSRHVDGHVVVVQTPHLEGGIFMGLGTNGLLMGINGEWHRGFMGLICINDLY